MKNIVIQELVGYFKLFSGERWIRKNHLVIGIVVFPIYVLVVIAAFLTWIITYPLEMVTNIFNTYIKDNNL